MAKPVPIYREVLRVTANLKEAISKTIDIDYYLIPRGLAYRTNSANVIEIKRQDMQEVSRRHSII